MFRLHKCGLVPVACALMLYARTVTKYLVHSGQTVTLTGLVFATSTLIVSLSDSCHLLQPFSPVFFFRFVSGDLSALILRL